MAFHTILDTEESVFHRLAYQKNASKRLCYRKWLMLFSLKFQRDNRKNALAVDSAKGKTGKSLYFHHAVEIKQPHATIGLLKVSRR